MGSSRVVVRLALATLLVGAAVAAHAYDVLASFAGLGPFPGAALIQGTDGSLYGTTVGGGANSQGTIFKIDTNGTLTTLHSFSGSDGAFPQASLIQATDGNLYGTTYGGGANSSGTIFKIDVNGTTLTTLHTFSGSDGAFPYAGLLQATDGNLYGTTTYGGVNSGGTIFKVDTEGATFTTLHNFTGGDGNNPQAALIQATDGNLYGTTYGAGAGTVFKIDTNGTTLTTIHSFSFSDGANPQASLIQATDGNLYGTTYYGGANNSGTIFKIDTNGTTLTTLHSFSGSSDGANPQANLIQAANGSLYGATYQGGTNGQGTIFKIDTNGTTLTTLHSFAGSDGAYPYAGLIQATDGNLYGTTYGGGANNSGVIFKIDTSGGTLTTLYSFAGINGANPQAGLIQAADGNLYGTTYGGGANSLGTIFKIDTSGGTLTTLYSFAGSDGSNPQAGLLQATDGNLYGTTYGGGANSSGTIFKIDTNGTTLTTLYSFADSDGANPRANLIQATDGNLYGTTYYGGLNNAGTIFKIDTNGTTLTTLYSFGGIPLNDGAFPEAGLIQGADGNLYGTTANGGLPCGRRCSGPGTVFKIDTNGTTLTTLHRFSAGEGAYPHAGLIQATDGNLYGTTYEGGAHNQGTIFKIDTNGTTLTTLHSFSESDGEYPQAGLLQATDGNLYGTTYSGGPNYNGTIFRIDANGTTLTTLYSFAWSAGALPEAGMIQGSDGNLYGTTDGGGSAGGGVVFGFDFCTLGQPPVITANGPTTFCEGGSVTLDAGAGYASYFWSPGRQTTQTIVVTTSGSFTVSVFDANGCTGTSIPTVVTVNPNPAPVITPSGPTTFCAGGSVTLDAGAGYASYLWSPGGQTTETVIVTTSGSFTVNVTHADGCTNISADTVVTVSPIPTPVITTSHCIAQNTTGLMASVPANAGDTYSWTLTGGTIDSGQGTNAISFTSGSPGTSATLSVVETTAANCSGTANLALQVDYSDVPTTDLFYTFVCALGRDGITAGCGGGDYCRDNSVTRAQMAVFLLKAEHGSSYVPPACMGIFPDVECSPTPAFAVDWIERLYNEGITGGCGNGDYCPDNPVTREQMAVFLLKAKHGSDYVPPACAGIFTDVTCPSQFANWIEELYGEGITSGCAAGLYCPTSPNTRGQMAVFLVKTFGLLL